MYGDFAGGQVARRHGFFDRKSALQAPDEIADADVARRPREPIPAAASDLTLQKIPAPQGEKDRFEKLIRKRFLLAQIFRLHVRAWILPGELHGGAEAVFGSLAESHAA